ncbi:MAG TPA: RNA pyrophosphohydrolase [Micropepsaceae bacterium]|nr:RNA pyrophosphohydrolase [Micropepsaceae bacterium]
MSKATAESLPYRPSVGMMLLNRDGRIFVGKRIDQTQEAWQMPQGGIDDGEDAKTAGLRELEEEIGTRNAELLREHPDWLLYELPPHLLGVAWEGKYRGQRLKWLALRFLGRDDEINVATSHAEFSEWKWLKSADVLRLVVPFKREVYAAALAAFDDLTAK